MKPGTLAVIFFSVLVSACGGGGGDTPDNEDISTAGPLEDDTLERFNVRDEQLVYPYRDQSAFSGILKDCALIARAQDACTLQQLPYIGQSGPAFSRADVMDRLLVTHDWMGERFETLLNQAPDDMLPLFGSLTSIVIGSTVRPSNYWTGTGGIRLDPAYLWMTIAEKANVSIEEDFRSDFGRELNFLSGRASRINGQSAYPFYSLTSLQERSLEDLQLPFYSLMYHELGHAVDYVNADLMPLINPLDIPANNVDQLNEFRASAELTSVSPLNSIEMTYLAQVQFRGFVATAQQIAYTPADVGAFMASDGGAQYYSYSTEREDFANLMEAAMMKKNFDMDLLIGYFDKPQDEDNISCSELIVGWGQHNRLSDPLVLPRAQWVVDRVYGISDENNAFFDAQSGLARNMIAGLDWCENRDETFMDASARSSFPDRLSTASAREQLKRELEQRLH